MTENPREIQMPEVVQTASDAGDAPRNETTGEASRDERREAIERALVGLFDIGRMWARHGLSIGRGALETSSATLKTTARVLGDLSEAIGQPKANDEAKDEPSDRAA